MALLRRCQLQFCNYYYYIRVGSDICASLMKLATKNKGGPAKGGFHGTHGTPSRSTTGIWCCSYNPVQNFLDIQAECTCSNNLTTSWHHLLQYDVIG